MGEVLCDGFNLAMIYIPVTEGEKTRICIVDIKDKNMGFVHIDWIYPLVQRGAIQTVF